MARLLENGGRSANNERAALGASGRKSVPRSCVRQNAGSGQPPHSGEWGYGRGAATGDPWQSLAEQRTRRLTAPAHVSPVCIMAAPASNLQSAPGENSQPSHRRVGRRIRTTKQSDIRPAHRGQSEPRLPRLGRETAREPGAGCDPARPIQNIRQVVAVAGKQAGGLGLPFLFQAVVQRGHRVFAERTGFVCHMIISRAVVPLPRRPADLFFIPPCRGRGRRSSKDFPSARLTAKALIVPSLSSPTRSVSLAEYSRVPATLKARQLGLVPISKTPAGVIAPVLRST